MNSKVDGLCGVMEMKHLRSPNNTFSPYLVMKRGHRRVRDGGTGGREERGIRRITVFLVN